MGSMTSYVGATPVPLPGGLRTLADLTGLLDGLRGRLGLGG